jgi:hypothetical protein
MLASARWAGHYALLGAYPHSANGIDNRFVCDRDIRCCRLLLPGRESPERALMCWSTSTDGTSVTQFWVMSNRESRVFCTATFLEPVSPQQLGDMLCA